MASGVGGLPADCHPAPRPQGLRFTRDPEVEPIESLGFARVPDHPLNDCGEQPCAQQERFPEKGRGKGANDSASA